MAAPRTFARGAEAIHPSFCIPLGNEAAGSLPHGERRAEDGALYTGVTSDLAKRVWQHRNALLPGFTQRYGCKLLVWYELHADMTSAIAREKQIKGRSRKAKLRLIQTSNPLWRDLYDQLV
ncbi:MAG: GIY-YIG nuclease family protein [Acetobacteraceae bacterium]